MEIEQIIKIEPIDIDNMEEDPHELQQATSEQLQLSQLSPLQLQLSQPRMSSPIPTPLGQLSDSSTQKPPPKLAPCGPTNYERYNILVKAYIAAHPQLPRQMQYAEAQQVWRSVRMDPYGAYLEVLRSLHGMALLAQAAGMITPSYEVTLRHPLMIQALNPNFRDQMQLPPVKPPRNRYPKSVMKARAAAAAANKPKPLKVKVMKIMSLTSTTNGNKPSGMNRTYARHARTYSMVDPLVTMSPTRERTVLPIKRPRGRPRKIRLPGEDFLPNVTSTNINLPITSSSESPQPPSSPTLELEAVELTPEGSPIKRRRGRPRKEKFKANTVQEYTVRVPIAPNLLVKKRGRGRPRKIRPWEVQENILNASDPTQPPSPHPNIPLVICYEETPPVSSLIASNQTETSSMTQESNTTPNVPDVLLDETCPVESSLPDETTIEPVVTINEKSSDNASIDKNPSADSVAIEKDPSDIVNSLAVIEYSGSVSIVEEPSEIVEIAEDSVAVFTSPVNTISLSDTDPDMLPSPSSPSLNFSPNIVMIPKQEAEGSDQWIPQAGLSFVQGNGLKMILSRVNNGQPIPEYRRRRSRKKRAPAKPTNSPQVCNVHTVVDIVSEELSPRDQAADSTVMDIMAHHIPMSASHYGLEVEQSPDQPFAATILQYLLDLAEMLGSSTTFIVSQETENLGLANGPNISVFSGWLMGDQSSGPKLMATSRISTSSNEIDSLNELVNNEDFQEVVRTQYGRVKPVAILILEGRRAGDMGKLLEDSIDCFKEWDLDSIILASQPVGGNHILTTLDHIFDRNMMANGGHLPETEIYHHRTQTIEMEQWKNHHVRESQYYLQVVKCSNQACCSTLRTPIQKLLHPNGFLPPPVPFSRGEQGPVAPRFNEREMACYGRLCERLVMEPLIPKTAFRDLPFDFYCPSAHEFLSRRVCFDCGHYFGNSESRKLHGKFLHESIGDKSID